MNEWKETEIGTIPHNWQISTLDEISEKITDGSHFSPKEYLQENRIIATVKDMRYNNFSFEDCKRISDKDFFKLKKDGCSPQKGDIIISKDGANCLDLIFVYEQDEEIVLLSSIAIVKLNKEFNPYFYRYYLLSPTTQKIMREGFVSGSAIPRVILKNFKKIPVPILPNKKLQDKIAEILCSLDEKIELNRKMNQTLEQIAQAIFKHWFIDFEFPNEAGKPYKSSGGEMVDSELGEIPKGWKIVAIKDIADKIQYGYTQSSSQEKIGPKFLRITDIQNGKIDWNKVPYCKINDKEIEKYKIKDRDIFIARTGASTGENVYINDPPESVFASYLVRFQFKEKSIARLVASHLRTSYYFNFIDGIIGGSAQPNASAQTLASFKILLPPINLVNRFYLTLDPLDRKKISNSNQSQLLSILRDNLLPKLISGKIRVKTDE